MGKMGLTKRISCNKTKFYSENFGFNIMKEYLISDYSNNNGGFMIKKNHVWYNSEYIYNLNPASRRDIFNNPVGSKT